MLAGILPFFGSVTTIERVHKVCHSPVFQSLLQTEIRSSVMASSPAWTCSADMLFSLANFPIFSALTVASILSLNPNKHNGLSYPYTLGEPICRERGSGVFFHFFVLFEIEISVSKQWRPWSDAALCGVWFRTALFAYVPQKGRQGLYWLKWR